MKNEETTDEQSPFQRHKRTHFESRDFCFKPMTEKDQELMFRWRTDPETARFLSGAPPISLDQQLQWFASVERDPSTCFYIFSEKSTTGLVPIGYILFTGRATTENDAKFGVVLGARTGQGVGRLLLSLICRLGFDLMGFDGLYASIQPGNAPAVTLVDWMGGRLVHGPHLYRKSGELLLYLDPAGIEPALTDLRRRDPEEWKELELTTSPPENIGTVLPSP